MTLEQQVTSLDLSKRLKELGVKQESLFWWTTDNLNFVDDKCAWWLEPTSESYARRISAFTVAELAEILNIELTDANESESYILQISSAIDFWCVWIGNEDIKCTPQIENVKLADALAELLEHLLENKLITL